MREGRRSSRKEKPELTSQERRVAAAISTGRIRGLSCNNRKPKQPMLEEETKQGDMIIEFFDGKPSASNNPNLS